jgi:hypothetical protein
MDRTVSGEHFHSFFLVQAHESGISDNVGEHDGCVSAGFGHFD